ncbi:hypothetical protein H9Y05_12545 [Crocinitomicaceae bacterium CZZ-1]|uniref:Uncharacterized protein n=2 Tax=Taishania pollutisoli TaxID=2766479 RepID=A0A8J6TTS7_9FLAO|nr:hypothetical protein [Taishania pollutisoli]MBX2977575.1 hypothetical protein [Ignavibacteriaceae bacterium]
MSQETTYTKIMDLIHKKEFEAAIDEVEHLKKNSSESIQLILLSIYCKVECGRLRSAAITVSKALKRMPEHQLLGELKVYLSALKSGKNLPNPLNEFVHAFTTYANSKIPTDLHQFNLLMDQILVKPFIK